jgi:hypothetical protein
MSNYTPGEGYEKGFQCRMNGGQKPSQAVMTSDPYWQEYDTGWNDADLKIIKEAREKFCSKPSCCKSKNFIQD